MADIVDLGKLLAKLPGETGSGLDPSQETEYESIREELDNLTNPNSDGSVDWHKVEALASEILSSKAKDLLVATWLGVALIETKGIHGLGHGIKLLAALTHDYWDTMYPSLKRMRGRRNAIDWWQGRAKDWLQVQIIDPILASELDSYVKSLESLDQELSERDPDSLPLTEFLSYLKRVDVIPDPIEEDVSAAAAAEDEVLADAPTSVESSNPEASQPFDDAGASVQKQSPLPSAGGIPAANLKINAISDLPAALAPIQDYLSKLSDGVRAVDPFNPLISKLSRFAVRSSILTLPPAQSGTTRIPNPRNATFDGVLEAGNPEAIFNFCESRIGSSPFWLDLDIESARALSKLGHEANLLRQAVIDDVLSFVQRLPGVELLKFDDGTPFASPETRSFIESAQAERSGGGGTDAFSICSREAMGAFSEGDVESAMAIYQAFIENTREGRNQFRARLALVGLLMDARDDVDPMPYIEPLIDECDRRSLGDWEPELVFATLVYKLRALKQMLTELEKSREDDAANRRNTLKGEVDSTLKRMAILDFVETLRQY